MPGLPPTEGPWEEITFMTAKTSIKKMANDKATGQIISQSNCENLLGMQTCISYAPYLTKSIEKASLTHGGRAT